VVYFGCRDSNFYALDTKTGEKKWAFSNHGSWVISSPAVADGNVYFATSDSGLFHALNAKTGAPVFSLSFSGWPMFSSPAVVGNMVLRRLPQRAAVRHRSNREEASVDISDGSVETERLYLHQAEWHAGIFRCIFLELL
jgi:PQQ-like domain